MNYTQEITAIADSVGYPLTSENAYKLSRECEDLDIKMFENMSGVAWDEATPEDITDFAPILADHAEWQMVKMKEYLTMKLYKKAGCNG